MRVRRAYLALIALAVCLPLSARADESNVDTSAEGSPWEQRARQEEAWRSEGLPLIPHHRNYFFPVTYNTTPHGSSAYSSESVEAKFQFSVKVLLWNAIGKSNLDLYFAYTQLSMWQVYNRSQSAPFRDTNHEPEIFVSWPLTRRLGGVTLRRLDLGINHQSNGVSFPDSRSWNRVIGQGLLDWGNWAFTVRPWIRIPDQDGHDDNPDIERYMGHGEFTVEYFRRNHVLSAMFRNNLRSNNKGAIRVDYTFPLTRNLTGLVQYFTGYGESLLDYNRPDNRYSIGIALGNLGS